MSASAEADALLEALRANVHILNEIAVRYEVETLPEREAGAPAVRSLMDVQELLAPEMATLAQEQVRVLLLDRKNRLVGQRVIYQGSAYAAIVRPAELLRPVVTAAVPHLILAHNHPSGDPTPSPNDIELTKQLAEAATLLGVDLLDHVVIGRGKAVSLKEQGFL